VAVCFPAPEEQWSFNIRVIDSQSVTGRLPGIMKSIDRKSCLFGALATVMLLACTDATPPNLLVPEAKAATVEGKNTEIGRYVFHSSSPTFILDSVTGTVYYGAQFDEGPWKKHHWLEE
jgi:hypothetical protein